MPSRRPIAHKRRKGPTCPKSPGSNDSTRTPTVDTSNVTTAEPTPDTPQSATPNLPDANTTTTSAASATDTTSAPSDNVGLFDRAGYVSEPDPEQEMLAAEMAQPEPPTVDPAHVVSRTDAVPEADPAVLRVGLTRDTAHIYRWNGGQGVPGVTSVVGVLDKSAPLVGWAKRETAASAIRNLSLLGTMVETGGPESAQKWLSQIPDYQKEMSADLGTRLHALAEASAKGEPVDKADADVLGRLENYLRWQRDVKPQYIGVEYMVYSHEYEYGGTADMAVVIDGVVWLIDIKTGNKIYGETALQLVALDRAEFVGRPGDPNQYRVPKAEKFGVLHVTDSEAELVPYDVGDFEWSTFIGLRTAWQWRTDRAPVVKGVRVWQGKS